MARTSAARRSGTATEPTDSAYSDGTWDDDPLEREPRRRPRAGSGGRWWIWVGRAVLWAFIIVVLFNGIWLPLRGGLATPTTQESTENSGPDFPETAGAAFASRFADTYLSGGADEDRAAALAEFVPEEHADDFARETASGLSGENIQVLRVEAADAHNAVVTLTADINGEAMRLDVPLYADSNGTAFVVSGQPALLAPPDRAALPESSGTEIDTEVRDALEPELRNFFEAYAETPEHLERYLESGARVEPLPPDTLRYSDLRDVVVPTAPPGGADVRQARATVVWRLAGDSEQPAELTQDYLLTVVRDDDSWDVRDIQGAPHSFES